MKRRIVLVVVALIAASLGQLTPAAGRQPDPEVHAAEVGPLDVYTATVTESQAAQLADAGVDIIATAPAGPNLRLDAVLSQAETAPLEARTGVDLGLKRNAEGLTVSQQAAQQAANGFNV